MNGNLIDTNVIIKVINGNKEAINFFDSIENVYIPVVSLGELMYGASKSLKKEYNTMLFNDFTSEYPVLHIDSNVAVIYGEVKHSLLKKGVNIPENDIWIASTAIANNLNLVTYDKHFREVEDMKVVIL